MKQPNYPQALAALPNWICWRLEPDSKGRDAKIPYSPMSGRKASSTNPDTWTTLDSASEALRRYSYYGLGFVFTKEAGIVGVDIDHCIDPDTGALNETAAAILAKLPPTYIEISPSGTGLHIFLRGAMSAGGSRNAKNAVEMYAHARYFTMTGNRYGDCPVEVADDNGALAWIHETYIKQKRERSPRKNPAGQPLSDDEILEKARSSGNGAAFASLWKGCWQAAFPSQSEADLALCCKLAFWSGKNREQTDRMFRQSGLMRPKWDERHHADGASYGEETVSRALETVEEGYSTKSDTPVFAYNGRYYRAKGDNIYPLTNFVVRPIEMIVSDDETQMTADLVTVKGEVFRQSFMTTDFSNLPKFKNLLNRRTIALSYTGTEGDLELLKNFISELDWVRKTGVKALGLYWIDNRWVYASTEGAIAQGGKAVDSVVQLERHQSIKSALHTGAAITKEQLTALGPLLLGYNELAKTTSVLAWAAGCFLKPHLRHAGIKFPHLFLVGEAGSGKSNTLERVILPIFSRTKITAATQVTPFTLMRDSASSNLVPQPLDEFKPSKTDRLRICALYNHFRDAYDGHEGQRGRIDLSTANYELLAPLVVAGEESADEAAVRERSIELLFSKKDLRNMDCRETFTLLCGNEALLAAFGRGLLEMALGIGPEQAQKWHRDAMKLFSKELPSRIRNNLAACYAGLCLAEKLCVSLGLAWGDVFPVSMELCARHLEYAAVEYLLDGNLSNSSVLEQTFEIMARMGLDPQTEYALCEDGRVLALWLNQVYDRYTKYRKDYAVWGETLTYAQFKKQLQHSAFYIDSNVTRRFGCNTHKVWLLDFDALKARCDVAGFESTALAS